MLLQITGYQSIYNSYLRLESVCTPKGYRGFESRSLR